MASINFRMTDIPSSRSAYNEMCKTNRAIDKTIDELTGKLRINSAADDAAGLAISEKMRGEISGLEKALSNAQDGITMLQIAEGGLEDISSVVQKLRELAVQSANGVLTASDREALNAEFKSLRKEIDRLADTTKFNKKKLLNGNASALWSSSDLSTYVILNGAITETDENGEKTSAEGNYDLSITAKAGQAEVQKTAQFHINYDASFDPHYELEGTGIYYGSSGNSLTLSEAVQSFGTASWLYHSLPGQNATTYKFELIGTNESGAEEVTTVQTTITSGKFFSPHGFVSFMNSEPEDSNNSTLYGTGYEAYYNEQTGKLGIRSSHAFTVNDKAGGFQRLFGSFYDNGSSSSSSAAANRVSSSSLPLISIDTAPRVGASVDYDIADGDITISSDGDYRITGNSSSARIINIAAGVNANVTFSDMTTRGASRIYIAQNANVTFNLEGTNNLGANSRSPIVLNEGSTLTVNGTGTLNATLQTKGNNTITVNGGTINAEGALGTDASGAGIQIEESSTLIVNDGTINASGYAGSAAIGGSSGKSGGTITINGGTVNATGGASAAAIGGGSSCNTGGTITINGGDITATGGNNAAGIGGGYECASGGIINITDGNVKATGQGSGAGIGGGYVSNLNGTLQRDSSITANSGTITISGGTVDAQSLGLGAGIGGGQHMDNGTVNISGGNITAISNSNGAGIGGGSGGSGGNINITDGNIHAESKGTRGAGIGSGSSTNSNDTAGNIAISGGFVTAIGGSYAAGIGTGYLAEGGTVNISGGLVVANGGEYGAGIGTGYQNSQGLDVTISGGSVSASGGKYGAGIGGGQYTEGGNITITGGVIEATSGESAASIGGGQAAGSGNINIQDGMYFGDNTGFIKTFDETGNSGYIGSGSYVLIGDDITEDAGFLNTVIPAGSTATEKATLRELVNFYSNDGKFLLDIPQKLGITQGDGKNTSITVYAQDTLEDVAQKLNDAIAYDLGQAKYISNSEAASNFAVYVSDESAEENSSESVPGTLIIRSAVAGKDGTLRFTGSQELLDTLGLSTLQEAKENEFSVSVRNAHTNETLATREQITGNRINGVIHENIDISFDNMAGISTTWNDNTKKFSFSEHTYDTTIHIADNSTNLQIGAFEKHDVNFIVADVSTKALGIDSLDIADQVRAAEAVTSIDSAIDKISSQSAKVGATINRLQKTSEVIAVMHEHATESESRIRDADMAKAELDFTKLSIMLNAQQSVFAQSNQSASNILSIIR